MALARGFDDRKLTAVARPFLLVWASVGVGLWLVLSRGDWLSAMTADAWLLFARIPLAILGAIGLWHACERRFPDALTTAVFGSVAALGAINLLGMWRGDDVAWGDERIGRMMVGGMIAVWLAGAIARRSLTGHERARCVVWSLTLTVALGCGAMATAAALARPPANDREWIAWRTQIDRIENADRCILLSAAKGGGRIAEPPAGTTGAPKVSVAGHRGHAHAVVDNSGLVGHSRLGGGGAKDDDHRGLREKRIGADSGDRTESATIRPELLPAGVGNRDVSDGVAVVCGVADPGSGFKARSAGQIRIAPLSRFSCQQPGFEAASMARGRCRDSEESRFPTNLTGCAGDFQAITGACEGPRKPVLGRIRVPADKVGKVGTTRAIVACGTAVWARAAGRA